MCLTSKSCDLRGLLTAYVAGGQVPIHWVGGGGRHGKKKTTHFHTLRFLEPPQGQYL